MYLETIGKIRTRLGRGAEQLPLPRWVYWLIPLNLVYLPFLVLPILLIFVGSLFSWTSFEELEFVGLANYQAILTSDLFYTVLGNTITYTLGNTILTVGGGLVLAVAIYNTYPKLRALFQIVFLIPYAIMGVGVGMIWRLVYNPRNGAANQILDLLGFETYQFLGSTTLALPSIIVSGVWWSIGFYTVIWIVGLANIDESLYEAAKLDGANSLQTFWYVTLPQLKPIGLFLIIISIITSLRVFGIVWVMTRGGPSRASEVMVTWMYKIAFVNNDMGMAAAVGVILFVLTMLVSAVTIRWAGLGGDQ